MISPLDIEKYKRVEEMVKQHKLKLSGTNSTFTVKDETGAYLTSSEDMREIYTFLCGYEVCLYRIKE